MPNIPSISEQEFRDLAPAVLDDGFLSRLTACAEGTQTALSEGELEFGDRLRSIQPRNVPSGLSASLLAAIGDAPFAVDDKILLFNKPANPAPRKRGNLFRFNIAAAAAVALLGSIAAFMVPAGSPNKTSGNGPVPAISPALPGASNFVPASYNRNLSETRDEGVIWRGKNQPHRVLRLTYMEQVTMENENGESVRMEQPRVEYVIIPELVD